MGKELFRLSIVFLMVSIQICIISGCGNDDDADVSGNTSKNTQLANISDYFPLNVGTEWTYETKDDNETGTTRITQKYSQNGIECYQILSNGHSPLDGLDQVAIINYSNNSELTFKSSEMDEEINLILLKKPLEVGTKWKISYEDGNFAENEIISISDEISTPFGIYKNVIRMRFFIQADQVNFLYFAKGVGIIKMTFDGFSDDIVPPEFTPDNKADDDII